MPERDRIAAAGERGIERRQIAQAQADAAEGNGECWFGLGCGGRRQLRVDAEPAEAAEQTAGVVLTNATSGLPSGAVPRMLDVLRSAEPRVVPAWRPMRDPDPQALALTGTWYWGPSAYGLRLGSDGMLTMFGLLNSGREGRFRQVDGQWIGLDGYHAGETLRPVLDGDRVIALDLGSFIYSRTPYDDAAPIPGGVDPAGWS